MLTRWSDLDRGFSVADELQRRMERIFQELNSPRGTYARQGRAVWPPVNLYDAGNELVVHALVPGLSEKDINITVNQDTITIAGERRDDTPEGYTVHRQERGQFRFSRSFTLPCQCDLERATASVKDGMLTVTLSKAEEAKPRQITVKAE